uniref:DUF1376 domain-containing protein n=1 Tax=Panagrellus redivivus TaxID=6233 RepID=A0A7E4VLU9_PANRE
MSLSSATVSPSFIAGFNLYAHGKEAMLRQLEPFADKDDQYIQKMLRRAFVNLSANDKARFIAEAGHIKSNTSKNNNVDTNIDNEKPVKSSLNAALLYQSDIRHIIHHDKEFSQMDRRELFKLLWSGWAKLDAESKQIYNEKTQNNAIKKSSAPEPEISDDFTRYMNNMPNWMQKYSDAKN